jgi:hypothetical protein
MYNYTYVPATSLLFCVVKLTYLLWIIIIIVVIISNSNKIIKIFNLRLMKSKRVV